MSAMSLELGSASIDELDPRSAELLAFFKAVKNSIEFPLP